METGDNATKLPQAVGNRLDKRPKCVCVPTCREISIEHRNHPIFWLHLGCRRTLNGGPRPLPCLPRCASNGAMAVGDEPLKFFEQIVVEPGQNPRSDGLPGEGFWHVRSERERREAVSRDMRPVLGLMVFSVARSAFMSNALSF